METLRDIISTEVRKFRELRFPHIQTLIKYLERVPFFIHKISGSQMNKFDRMCVTFLIGLYIASQAIMMPSWARGSDLPTLVYVLHRYIGLATACCYMWYVWRNTEKAVTMRDLERFDVKFRIEHGDTSDYFACVWAIILPFTWCVRLASTLYYQKQSFNLWATTSIWILFNNPISQMFLLKYMIVKRFRVIIKRLDEQDVFSVFPSVRSLVKMDAKINEFYSPLLFFWSLLYYVIIATLPVSAWYYLVLNPSEHDYHPIIYHSCLMAILILSHHAAMFCQASVSDQIEDMIHEMDRSISDYPFDTSQRFDEPGPSTSYAEPRLVVPSIAHMRKILVLMQELEEASTEPTAYNLFSVCPDSLTIGLSLIIDITIVLFQLM